MPKLTMTVGLPGSGKSSYALEQVAYSNNEIKRVNKDLLRLMTDGGKHSKGREHGIIEARNALVKMWLKAGKNVIVDDTNFGSEHPMVLRYIAEQCNAEFSVKDFTHVSMNECLENNRNRTDKDPVPEKVIFDMWYKYIRATPERKEHAADVVLCDLDGTLCGLNGRSPYDASTCENDTLLYPAATIIFNEIAVYDTPIIFMSGREEKHREQSIRWLQTHMGIMKPELYMRATGDQRKDYVVKKELFKWNVEPFYNVKYVVDDRPQVIRMWRFDLCLPCVDVGYGIEF